jgi:fatty-acyl-CoA synthase
MLTTMMDFPLSTQMILRHGRRIHAASKVGTSDEQGFQFTTFEEIASRVDKLASALKALGVSHNTRVATYCWNHQRHLECYLTVPSLGAVQSRSSAS